MIKHGSKSIRYPGGKNAEGTWQWLLGLMPLHTFYAEPFAGSFGLGRRKVPALSTVAIDRDATVCNWLRSLAMPGVAVRRGCGIKWLREHKRELDRQWLIYFDPPYMHGTRVKKKLYRYEMTDRQHGRMLDVALSLASHVMISGYESPSYRRRLGNWERHERWVTTRGGTPRLEIVWCNFASTIAAAGDGILLAGVGDDFRERERTKRLLTRWRSNYRRRPRHVRRALLGALIADEARRTWRGLRAIGISHRRGRR